MTGDVLHATLHRREGMSVLSILVCLCNTEADNNLSMKEIIGTLNGRDSRSPSFCFITDIILS